MKRDQVSLLAFMIGLHNSAGDPHAVCLLDQLVAVLASSGAALAWPRGGVVS